LLGTRLRRRGFEVIAVADGAEALAAIRARRPAAAVLDWAMPSLEGPAICRAVKADPATAQIPVVLLTASAMREDVDRGLAHGADGYMTKPFDLDELVALLRHVIAAPAS
jgi:two-component system response regulator MtrA